MTSTMELVAPPNCSFCKQKAAELKQLQEQITNLRDQARIHGERYRAMEAEVERLQESELGDRADAATQKQGWVDRCTKLEGEIERLRRELLSAREVIDQGWNYPEGKAKIDRLREAIGLATTAVPTMEMDVDDPIGMMHRVVNEIQRLREGLGRSEADRKNLNEESKHCESECATLRSRLDAAVEQCHMILGWVEDDSTVEMQVEVILDKLIGGGR